MRRPGDPLFSRSNLPRNAERPARVVGMRGIIFQSDGTNLIGALFIRPVESLDRWVAGLGRSPGESPLAMHAGMHVLLEDGREFVAEQLVGSLFEDFRDALNWTPIAEFRERDHRGGWDATVPATAFREIDETVVHEVVRYLNDIPGHPFLGEDCTALIERAFGGRRLFGDSPTGHALGFSLRVGDPALPLLRPEARLDERSERLLRADSLRKLRNPSSSSEAPNRPHLGRANDALGSHRDVSRYLARAPAAVSGATLD